MRLSEIQVIHKKDWDTNDTRSHYVGRPSALGNPIAISEQQTREAVIGYYKQWLDWKLSVVDPKVCEALDTIATQVMDDSDKPVKLVCWCAPKACHADIIKQTIEKAIKESMEQS